VSVTYHPRVRQTKFYVLSFPAIWSRFIKIQCGSVTETLNAAVYIRWAYWLQKAEGWSIWRKSHTIKSRTMIYVFFWRRILQVTMRTHRNFTASCATLRWRRGWLLLSLLLLSFLIMENWWIEILTEKPVPVPLCPPQAPRGLTWDRTRASAVGGRQLTAGAMARP
jgi:hypothetical protein